MARENHWNFHLFFPECVARVPVSLWGSGGSGCVRSTLPNRPQPSAWTRYGRAYGKFCKRGRFWRFETSCCFVSRGQAWHFVTFRRVSCRVESRFVWQGQYICDVSEDALQFSWQAQHFRHVHRHFTWQAQHFRRVVWRVFCESHCQGCVKWRKGANSVAGVALCEMWWKLTEAWQETSILEFQIFRF